MTAPPTAPTTGRALTRTLLTVFVVALALRLWYVGQIGRTPFAVALVGDEQAYSARAQALLRDGWLAGNRPFYQDPLYPYVLALAFRSFGLSFGAVRVLQCVLGALGCAALAWVGARALNRRVGAVAGMFLAGFPRAWFYDAQIEKTGPTVAITALALALWWWAARGPSRRWAAVGFTFGLLCLLRGNFLALALPAALACWWWSRSLGAVLWLMLASTVAIAPATMRNVLVSGELVLVTSQGGQNFFIGNWADNDTGLYLPPPFLRAHAEHEEDDLRRYAEHEMGRQLTAREVSGVYWRWGLIEVRRDPVKFLRASTRRLLWLWHPDEVPDNHDERFLARFIPALQVGRWYAFALLAMGLSGSLLAWRQPLARLALGFALLYAASLVAFFVFGRYRMPLFPGLCLGSALWVERLVSAVRERRSGAVLRVIAPVGLLFGVWRLVPNVPNQDAQNWNTYGTALERAGNRPAARHAYTTARDLDPDNPLAAYNVARLLAKDGRLRDAIQEYRRSIRLHPYLPETHFQLGVCLLDLGEIAAGAAELDRALELDPGLGAARVERARAAELAAREPRDGH